MKTIYGELRKNGDSLVITIPARMVRENNWDERTLVKVNIEKVEE